MDASSLEALRLQALSSLQFKKPKSLGKEEGEVSDADSPRASPKKPSTRKSVLSGPSKRGEPKELNSKPRRVLSYQKMMAEGAKTVHVPNRTKTPFSTANMANGTQSLKLKPPPPPLFVPATAAPSIFSSLTRQMMDKSSTQQPARFLAPPRPVSFQVDAPKEPKPAKQKISFVIDLDSTDDEPDAVDSECPPPRDLTPCPSNESSRSQHEQTIAQLREQIAQLDASYIKNEQLMRESLQKQKEFKAKARQYRDFVKAAKKNRPILASKRAELSARLSHAKKMAAGAIFKLTYSPTTAMQQLVLSSEDTESKSGVSIADTPSVAETIGVETEDLIEKESSELKRKAELLELGEQLNRVQQDLEQSKLSLISTKKRKLEEKSLKPKDRGLTRDLRRIFSNPRVKDELQARSKVSIGTELIIVDGHLYPLEVLQDIVAFVKELLPCVPSEKASETTLSDRYDSPLRWFKSSIFFDHFLEFCTKKGLLSTTFINKIDPMTTFCKAEFEFGCTDKTCKFQHLNQVQLSNDELLETIIKRLLEFNPKARFETTEEILNFIRETLSGSELRGAPIVSLITKLLAMKKAISDEETALKPLCIDRNCHEPLSVKKHNTVVKTFLSTAESLPGRYFFDSTRAVLQGDKLRRSRYYANSALDDSEHESELSLFIKGLPEDLKIDENKKAAVEAFSQANFKDIATSLSVIDLASAFHQEPIFDSSFDTGSLAVLWTYFMIVKNFQIKCKIASKLLLLHTDELELFNLVLALTKSAVDTGRLEEALSIFEAVLQGEISLGSDGFVPSVQLCNLPVELGLPCLVKLWLFYFELLNNGTYSDDWFLSYPYDTVVDFEFFPLVQWTKPETYDLACSALRPFASCEDVISAELASYNLINLYLADGRSVSAAVNGSRLAVALEWYLTGPSKIEDEQGDPFTVLVQAQVYWKHGLMQHAEDHIRSASRLNKHPCDPFTALLRSLQEPNTRSEKTVMPLLSNLSRIGLGLPSFDCIPLARHLQALDFEHLDLCHKPSRRHLKLKADASLDEICDALLGNPTDMKLWKLYFDCMVHYDFCRFAARMEEGSPQVRERCLSVAARFVELENCHVSHEDSNVGNCT